MRERYVADPDGSVRSWGARVLRGFVPVFVLLALWQVWGLLAPNPLLPPPSEWVQGIQTVPVQDTLLAVGSTLRAFVLGVVIATVIGSVGGVLIGSSPRVERALNPMLEFLRALPAPVIVPIAVLAWGSGLGTTLFAVVFASSWPVLMNTLRAVKERPSLYTSAAQTLQLTRWQHARHMVLPSAIPGILVGYRVAVPIALIVTILVEMITAVRGVGNLLLTAQRAYESAQSFGLLLIAGMLGYALTLVAQWITARALTRWPPELR